MTSLKKLKYFDGSVPTPQLSRRGSSAYRDIEKRPSSNGVFETVLGSPLCSVLARYPAFKENFEQLTSERKNEVAKSWDAAPEWLRSVVHRCAAQGNFVLTESDVKGTAPCTTASAERNTGIFRLKPELCVHFSRVGSLSGFLSAVPLEPARVVCRYFGQLLAGDVDAARYAQEIERAAVTGEGPGLSATMLCSGREGSGRPDMGFTSTLERGEEHSVNGQDLHLPDNFILDHIPNAAHSIAKQLGLNPDRRKQATVTLAGKQWGIPNFCIGSGGRVDSSLQVDTLCARLLCIILNKNTLKLGATELLTAGCTVKAKLHMNAENSDIRTSLFMRQWGGYIDLPFAIPFYTGLSDAEGRPVTMLLPSYSVEFVLEQGVNRYHFNFYQNVTTGVALFRPSSPVPQGQSMALPGPALSVLQHCAEVSRVLSEAPEPRCPSFAVGLLQHLLDLPPLYPVFTPTAPKLRRIALANNLDLHHIAEKLITLPDDIVTHPKDLPATLQRMHAAVMDSCCFTHHAAVKAQLHGLKNSLFPPESHVCTTAEGDGPAATT